MWLQRSELSCETSTFLDIARVIRYVMGGTARSVSNWYNRGDYRPCTHSGEPGTMRPRNKKRKLTYAGAAIAPILLSIPFFLYGQQGSKPAGAEGDAGDAIFSTETRLVQLPVTVTDKNGRLVTNLPQSDFQIFENGVLQTIKLFKREDVPV